MEDGLAGGFAVVGHHSEVIKSLLLRNNGCDLHKMAEDRSVLCSRCTLPGVAMEAMEAIKPGGNQAWRQSSLVAACR